MKKTVFLCFIITLFFAACENDEENTTVDYPVTLYPSRVVSSGNIKMFIGGKEIKDANIIKKYTRDFTVFELPEAKDMSGQITFFSPDSIVFGEEANGFIIQKNNNQFLFSYTGPGFYDASTFHEIQKYRNDVIKIPTGSNSMQLGAKDMRVGYGSYTNIDLCFLAFKMTKNSFFNHFTMSLIIMNEFDYDYPKELQSNDTIAIREFRVKYIVK